MEQNERILISQNEVLAEQIKGDIIHFKAPFNKLIDAYEDLDLGEMTSEVFDEIKTGQSTKSTQRYQAKLEKGLDDTGVKNATLRANLLQGTGEVAGAFLKAARAFMDTEFKPRGYGRGEDQVLTVDFISLDNDGELTITDQDFEAILEAHCRYYIQTPEEKELYSIVSVLCEKYKELEKLGRRMQLNNTMSFDRSFSVVDLFVSNVGPGVSPSMPKILGSCSMAKRMMKHGLL